MVILLNGVSKDLAKNLSVTSSKFRIFNPAGVRNKINYMILDKRFSKNVTDGDQNYGKLFNRIVEISTNVDPP